MYLDRVAGSAIRHFYRESATSLAAMAWQFSGAPDAGTGKPQISAPETDVCQRRAEVLATNEISMSLQRNGLESDA